MQQSVKQFVTLVVIAAALAFGTIGFLLSNGGTAWFANNDAVSADNMSVDVKTSPNLIIGRSIAELTGQSLQFAVHFNDIETTNMIAVTHDDGADDTYLKYLTNHYAVDHETGNAKDGMELEFSPVPADGSGTYFVDCTVYIASAFEELPVSSLAAAIIAPTTVDADHPYFNAASIDFYVGEVSAEGYRGTTSVAGGLGGESVELFPDGYVVPLNTEGSITVIMRCYFDGDLQDTTTKHAYINSHTVKAEGLSISVSFTAVDAATE